MKTNRYLLIFVLFALFLAGCQSNDPTQAASVGVETIQRTIAEGRLLPQRYTDLSFATAGRVSEVLVSEGDAVTAGQVLVRLNLANPEARQSDLARAEQELLAAQQSLDALQDPEAAAQRIAQAQYDLANLNQQIAARQEELDGEKDAAEPDELLIARLEAQLELFKAQVSSTQVLLDKIGSAGVDPLALQAAETRLVTAQAAHTAALAALQPVELTAPWDGTLASLDLVVGQPVSTGAPVATLADYSTWVVKTDNLTEIEVVGLKLGQEVVMTLDALPEVELTGKIESIRSKYEEKRGDITYTVTVALDEVNSQALWGMTVAVELNR